MVPQVAVFLNQRVHEKGPLILLCLLLLEVTSQMPFNTTSKSLFHAHSRLISKSLPRFHNVKSPNLCSILQHLPCNWRRAAPSTYPIHPFPNRHEEAHKYQRNLPDFFLGDRIPCEIGYVAAHRPKGPRFAIAHVEGFSVYSFILWSEMWRMSCFQQSLDQLVAKLLYERSVAIENKPVLQGRALLRHYQHI
jgi:hypothetical protein